MSNEFVLSDGCEELLAAEGIRVFVGPDGLDRAVFYIDSERNPLPGCDPNEFGYAVTQINYIEQAEGVAVCEVMKISELVDLRSRVSAGAQ
ncbi:hypothetical protein [Brevibacterium limosum]|uniref:hypothetical protein n=1 Tax=Brevibacterium limosum TaxID=2697565 RepID=UPI00141E7006|nr:hypothetical protein [Brevibacterium limosum]